MAEPLDVGSGLAPARKPRNAVKGRKTRWKPIEDVPLPGDELPEQSVRLHGDDWTFGRKEFTMELNNMDPELIELITGLKASVPQTELPEGMVHIRDLGYPVYFEVSDLQWGHTTDDDLYSMLNAVHVEMNKRNFPKIPDCEHGHPDEPVPYAVIEALNEVGGPRAADQDDIPGYPNANLRAAAERVRITSDTGGAKESKLARFDQIPTFPLVSLAEHYGAGNAKYPTPAGEKDNWRKGYNWSLGYAAMQRHANAFWSGEDIDAETGHSHLTAVAWHAFTLLEWTRHPELVAKFDDRQNQPS